MNFTMTPRSHWRQLAPWLLISAIAGAILLGCGSPRRSEPIVGPISLSAKAQQGQVPFMVHCYQCHPGGEAGLGPAINGKALPVGLIKTQVRNGLGVMPPFAEEKIPDPELDRLVDYLYALRTHKPARGK